MSRILATHALLWPIIRETVDPRNGQDLSEEILKPAGFMIEVCRPRGRDMREFDQEESGSIAGMMTLISRVSNLNSEEVELLDAADLMQLGNLLNEANVNGLPTGGPA